MKKSTRLILIFSTIALFLFFSNKFYYPLKNFFFSIFSPMEKFLWSGDNFLLKGIEPFFKAKEIAAENFSLEKEVLILKQKLGELKAIEKENAELRNALGLGLKKEFNLIFAEVISKKSNEDSFLIDRGKKDGVLEGMPAISSGKILIGRVGKVFENFSQIILISNPDLKFSIEIESKTENALAVCKGEGDFRARFEFLPKEAEVKEGALVKTSLLGGDFPKNLLVGEVKSVKNTDAEIFKEGEVILYFKELKIENLFLLKK